MIGRSMAAFNVNDATETECGTCPMRCLSGGTTGGR